MVAISERTMLTNVYGLESLRLKRSSLRLKRSSASFGGLKRSSLRLIARSEPAPATLEC